MMKERRRQTFACLPFCLSPFQAESECALVPSSQAARLCAVELLIAIFFFPSQFLTNSYNTTTRSRGTN